jgi:hypothetical protein
MEDEILEVSASIRDNPSRIPFKDTIQGYHSRISFKDIIQGYHTGNTTLQCAERSFLNHQIHYLT